MTGALLGRDRRTSAGFLVLAVVLALAGAVAVFVPSATTPDPGIDPVLRSTAPFVALQVVLLALAAAAAYYNDGLVVCWALALVPSLPWHAAVSSGPSLTRTAFRVAAVTVVVGTVGYVLGRGLRLHRADEPYPDDPVWTLLAGRDAAGVRRSLLGAAVLGLAFFAAFAGSYALDVPLQEFAYRTFGFPGAFVLLTAVATVQAYANDGLVLSWAAAFAPAFGYLAAFGPGAFDELLAAAVVAVVFPTFAAVAFGTAGFVLGAGLWRVREFAFGGPAADDA